MVRSSQRKSSLLATRSLPRYFVSYSKTNHRVYCQLHVLDICFELMHLRFQVPVGSFARINFLSTLCKRCAFWRSPASALESFCLRWGAAPLRQFIAVIVAAISCYFPFYSWCCCCSSVPSACHKRLRPCFQSAFPSMRGTPWRVSRHGCRITRRLEPVACDRQALKFAHFNHFFALSWPTSTKLLLVIWLCSTSPTPTQPFAKGTPRVASPGIKQNFTLPLLAPYVLRRSFQQRRENMVGLVAWRAELQTSVLFSSVVESVGFAHHVEGHPDNF